MKPPAPDPSPPSLVLSLHEVRIQHEQRTAWTPSLVSLSVAPGEVVLLLGPSGSGKSSLALAVNALIPRNIPARMEGQVITGGVNTADATVAELSPHVGMVFQDPDAQVITGTVLDEVCFGPENLLVPAEEVLQRAERALKHVGLWHRRLDHPSRLSGGGRQRLAIACALALESPLLVLDEPTANLDPASIEEFYSVLNDIVRSEKETRPAVLLIEHNLDAAIEFVDRIAVLDRNGRLVIDGPARKTLRQHAETLHEWGVWLPVVTLAALRLQEAGVPVWPMPLTPAELAASLDALPVLPTRPGPVAARSISDRYEKANPPSADLGPPAGGEVSERAYICVRELNVKYGDETIVRDVDLDVHLGEFLAIVGTNGAGKTTLAQALAGVLKPASGTVSIGNLDPARVDTATRDQSIGFVFQNPEHQFVTESVFEELAYGLRGRRRRGPRLSEHEVRERVMTMLHRFGLAELRDVHPFLLSGGQKRRLSVATALIVTPHVIVLDEPTFGQDREHASALLALLNDLRNAGTTIVVVTHDLQLVADHASHIAIMAHGELLAKDCTRKILSDPLLLQHAGLRMPPLASAMRRLDRHPEWRNIIRIDELPTLRTSHRETGTSVPRPDRTRA